MMEKVIRFNLTIEPGQQGSYFTVPFEVPQGIESLELTYEYPRRLKRKEEQPGEIFTATPETNIVDLGLIAPDGRQVGASGSEKTRILVSEQYATPGYGARTVSAGRWQVIVGAYQVAPEGVEVFYEITLKEKSLRLLKGDTHVHSIASDGVHTLEELALKAKANGLDFLAVTDHNVFLPAASIPYVPGITMIPGVEWTHYQGHANFLGINAPYDEPFFTNSVEEARSRFTCAHERGALITINHPFEGNSRFLFDFRQLPFDCLEVWNGPMRESNLKAVGLWQQMLSSGMRVAITGGSDYHRDTPFIFLGGPTMGVYALSAGMSDILSALRKGHSYITFAPDGPSIEMRVGEGIMGDQVDWQEEKELRVRLQGLQAGDVVLVVTAQENAAVFTATSEGELDFAYEMREPGFARVEVLRAFLPGLPLLPALMSNPVYFKA